MGRGGFACSGPVNPAPARTPGQPHARPDILTVAGGLQPHRPHLTWRPTGRSGRDRQLVVVVDRAEVGVLEFQHGVLGPRLSGAEVRVRYDDGSYAPAVFVPMDLDGLDRSLEQRGWPVTRTEWPPAHRELRALPTDRGRRTEPGSVYRPAGTSTASAVAWTVLVAVLLSGFVVGIGLGIASSAP